MWVTQKNKNPSETLSRENEKKKKNCCVTTSNYLTGNILECTYWWTKTCFWDLLLQVLNCCLGTLQLIPSN